MRSSLEADVKFSDLTAILDDLPRDGSFAEYCIVAKVEFDMAHDGPPAVTASADHKCGRCWRLLPEVSEDGALCGRCEDILA